MHEFNYEAGEVDARRQMFLQVAGDLISTGRLPDNDIVLRLGRLPILVDSYFILNHAYKKWRIKEGHLTQATKIAALTAMATMTVSPFRPTNFVANTFQQAKCNEIYALALAAIVMGNPLMFANKNSNLMMRIVDILTASQSETLQQFLVDREFSLSRPANTYDLDILDKDKLPVNALISIFELLSLTAPDATNSIPSRG